MNTKIEKILRFSLEKIKNKVTMVKLDLSNRGLTEISKIPSNVTVLNCSGNQLTEIFNKLPKNLRLPLGEAFLRYLD